MTTAAHVDAVTDPLLAATASRLARSHRRHGDDLDRCMAGCGERWPCTRARTADRAAVAARGPWHKAWTIRHDLAAAGVPLGAVW
ncbi:hypothetical protein Lfu02_79640 [Longispora fulva]|uniref:Uncharacterized protein n=1 Tax=Longispora fulva TaxID=619741 RepID=A0A8J7GNR1_9ACTN|nr:hypothetical protein [Longispora fulva]MBG6133981.1 hypothetical protein [Longispora fulva]GIG63592.1 hypothetical protein Lfu02_79640 [Longispora fulva]